MTPPQNRFPVVSPIVEHAIELATQWHDGTYRKGSWRSPDFLLPDQQPPRTPVVFHLTAVALAVQQSGWDDITIAASFLHDILEDPNKSGEIMTSQNLIKAIGAEVTHIVVQLTEQKMNNDGKPRSWKDRKQDYLSAIEHFSPQATAICLADKHHNLSTINQSIRNQIDVFNSTEHRKALSSSPTEQLWFYSSLVELTSIRKDERLVGLHLRLKEETEAFEQLIRGFAH